MRKLALVIALALSSPSALSQQWTDDETRAGMKKVDQTRFTSSGKPLTLFFMASLNLDCSPSEDYQFELTKEPEHGTVDFVPDFANPSYAKDNPRAKCNDKKVEGHLLRYQSNGGYTGMDSFTVLEVFPQGWARETTFHMNVRPIKSKGCAADAIEVPVPSPHPTPRMR